MQPTLPTYPEDTAAMRTHPCNFASVALSANYLHMEITRLVRPTTLVPQTPPALTTT